MEILGIILLIFAIFCAISVSMTKDLLTSLVIFMSQSRASVPPCTTICEMVCCGIASRQVFSR